MTEREAVAAPDVRAALVAWLDDVAPGTDHGIDPMLSLRAYVAGVESRVAFHERRARPNTLVMPDTPPPIPPPDPPMRRRDYDCVPTPEEAQECLSRFIHSHFRNRLREGDETARFTIPANPRRDDDLLLSAYIRWAGRLERTAQRVAELNPALISLHEVLDEAERGS